MKIAVLDLNGFALGPAIGLAALGHRVDYVPAEPRPGAIPSALKGYRDELLESVFGPKVEKLEPEADLLVLSDSFADQLWALDQGLQLDEFLDPARPFVASINPLAQGARIPRFQELAARAARVLVLDGSDRAGPRSGALAQLDGAALLAREVPLCEVEGAWRPFPYIYNLLMLLLECCRPREHWFVPFEARPQAWDWFFGGTVDHPRYGGRRAAWIAEVNRRWPGARGRVVPKGSSFKDILEQSQSALWGLDLPGNGELCFRLHENLALGIPVFRPMPWGVVVAPEVARVCRSTPLESARPTGPTVRAAYEAGYAPSVAARALLAAAFQ